MAYPDVQVPMMDIPAGLARQEGYILGIKLISRHRNGRFERPFELALSGAGMDIARPLSVEEVAELGAWCSRALAAHDLALYPEEADDHAPHTIREAAE